METRMSFRLALMGCMAAGAALVLAKVQGGIDWSWWVILIPTYLLAGMIVALVWAAHGTRSTGE